ncbi:MAG: hypothetical protein ACRDQ7_22165 [Haloechinothrix sp.]
MNDASVPLRRPARNGMRSTREFRRTPVHLHVLSAVREGRVAWRTTVGVSGGFVSVGGMPFPPGDELVALYELRNSGLIAVDITVGSVRITPAGVARLTQWISWQHGKAS